MKLQFKILIAFLISSFISIILSFVTVNLLINYFDKSYNRFDIEKLSIKIVNEIRKIDNIDNDRIVEILKEMKTKYEDIDFSYVDTDGNPVFSTRPLREFEPHRARNIDEMRKKLEEEERNISGSSFKKFKFLDYFDTRDMLILKPLFVDRKLKGAVLLSVSKDFSPPLTIRINNEKKIFIVVLLILSLALLIFFSYILVFIFTMPFIRRLNVLFHKIKDFGLDKADTKINDAHNDEIGALSNTFDAMSDKIKDDYNEKVGFFNERQELIKNVSHDFRTPLTSILGYAVSLDEGVYENEEEQKRYYGIIRKKAEYMKELFDEMMELSRLDSNTFLLKKKEFDISELIREIIIEYLPQLEKDKFFIETNIPGSVVIKGDKDRLSRVIRNMVDNVIRHANSGKYISFSVREMENFTEISILDKGNGVDENDLNRIFDRFYHRTGQQSGMGLGLSIAKEIIEKHGGRISVCNSKEGGAIFTVILPK